MPTRGNQEEYNRLLNSFNARRKTKRECVDYLISLGYSRDQADNAVHVYFKGGGVRASFRLTSEQRNKILDEFDAPHKEPKQCVNHLMDQGCSYRQATSAVHKYRQENGLIGK